VTELITQLPPRASVRLQVSARALPVAATVLGGIALPALPNTSTGDDPVICWIAPDAWLVQSTCEGAELAGRLQADFLDLPSAVTDLSDALVSIALDGPDAAAVLARGCGLDLRPAAFAVQSCARTRLAQLPVLIRRTETLRFELVVDRSAAQYLHGWLVDAVAGIG
jgi:sarcosine oxidase, subunit gamma